MESCPIECELNNNFLNSFTRSRCSQHNAFDLYDMLPPSMCCHGILEDDSQHLVAAEDSHSRLLHSECIESECIGNSENNGDHVWSDIDSFSTLSDTNSQEELHEDNKDREDDDICGGGGGGGGGTSGTSGGDNVNDNGDYSKYLDLPAEKGNHQKKARASLHKRKAPPLLPSNILHLIPLLPETLLKSPSLPLFSSSLFPSLPQPQSPSNLSTYSVEYTKGVGSKRNVQNIPQQDTSGYFILNSLHELGTLKMEKKKVGIYTKQERIEKIKRFKEKKKRALLSMGKVRYQVRKKLAAEKPRFKGRFLKTNSSESFDSSTPTTNQTTVDTQCSNDTKHEGATKPSQRRKERAKTEK